MIKLSLVGVAAVAFAALAVPSYAQSVPSRFANSYAQANYCADHEPGNPYNKETDYLGWSAWRARGGWDPTNDFNCIPSHMHHGEF
jgi:hypothetical protein